MKKIQCETKEVYRNKKSNMIYASKEDADYFHMMQISFYHPT